MAKLKKTPLAIMTAAGTLLTGLASVNVQAETTLTIDSNPFKISELSAGYMQTAVTDAMPEGKQKLKDGSCGEGKCGSSRMKGSEEKTAEGKCAGNKPMPKSDPEKAAEGKCGEGKCGGGSM